MRPLLAALGLAAALAASGTVTLELAVTGTPMIVGYKMDLTAEALRYLITADSVVLANLVLGRNVFPEFLQEKCTPDALQQGLTGIMQDGPARDRQLAALREISLKMETPEGRPPSEIAAQTIFDVIAAAP